MSHHPNGSQQIELNSRIRVVFGKGRIEYASAHTFFEALVFAKVTMKSRAFDRLARSHTAVGGVYMHHQMTLLMHKLWGTCMHILLDLMNSVELELHFK